MKLRNIDCLTAGICLFLLAGCTSPETQAIAPAPIAEPAAAQPTILVPDVPPATVAPALAVQPDAAPAVAAEAQSTVGTQQGFNCRTVGNATMCDAPSIPSSQDKLYTN